MPNKTLQEVFKEEKNKWAVKSFTYWKNLNPLPVYGDPICYRIEIENTTYEIEVGLLETFAIDVFHPFIIVRDSDSYKELMGGWMVYEDGTIDA